MFLHNPFKLLVLLMYLHFTCLQTAN